MQAFVTDSSPRRTACADEISLMDDSGHFPAQSPSAGGDSRYATLLTRYRILTPQLPFDNG